MKSWINKSNIALSAYWHYWQIRHSQYNSEEIKKIQIKKLKKMTSYVYKHVKYYQELFLCNHLNPLDIQAIEDIRKIPILTKQQIRERFWDFLPKALPNCRVYRTSGSSGVPICILSDDVSRIHNAAAIIRYRKALGMKDVLTPILTPLKKESDPSCNPHWTCIQGIHKTYYVNPYKENDAAAELIKKLKKPAIIGITPAIKALAGRIRDGLFPEIFPLAVFTVGESLIPSVRFLLEETFKVKVCDTYACSEIGDVAWQCPESSLYHINAENCIVEILDGKGYPVKDGEIGEVIITNLNRLSMPFIRYKNGDLARASSQLCSCGRKLPVFKEIIGRSGEDLYLPSGKVIPWNILKSAMNHNMIRQFQLVQNQDGSINVNYIPEQLEMKDEIDRILKQRFNTLLPDTVKINYEIVEKIPMDPSGKSKLVVCNYRP